MAKTTFVDGNPQQGVQGTIVTAEFLNALNNHRHRGLAQDGDGAIDYAPDTGAANAYVIALAPALTARVVGMPIHFMAANANTGPSTLNDGLGVVNISKNFDQPLAAGDIKAGQMVTVAWDGVDYQMLSQASIADKARITIEGVQNIPNNSVPIKVLLDTVVFDSNSLFVLANNGFVIKKAGYYQFNAQCAVNTSVGRFQTDICKNGSVILTSAAEAPSGTPYSPLNDLVYFNVGDIIELYFSHNGEVTAQVLISNAITFLSMFGPI